MPPHAHLQHNTTTKHNTLLFTYLSFYKSFQFLYQISKPPQFPLPDSPKNVWRNNHRRPHLRNRSRCVTTSDTWPSDDDSLDQSDNFFDSEFLHYLNHNPIKEKGNREITGDALGFRSSSHGSR
ncbi:hypothetical protein Sjap_007396 [Stephania japonica]|uniref:Uncharacterized protein n=1 Tax=Stephania japonica TaxID=461633 RepID=A0AAP0JPX9_9MAGN